MTIERRYPYPSTIINSHDEVEEDDDRSVFINHHVPNTFWSVLATSIACLGGLIFGYDLGVVGGILINPAFQSHFGIDPKDKSQEADVNGTIVSVLQVGCLFGALLATSTADTLGRKYSIIASSIIFIIGGILQVIGNGLSMLYIGRVIGGLGVGALSMLVPIYVAEIAHQQHRGFLGGLWMFFIAFGLAISYWTNYFVKKIVNDDNNNLLWRIPLTIQLIPALLLCMGMFCLFETPRWLCTHEKEDEARMVLAKVRCLDIADANITEEIKEIISSQSSGGGSSWRDVLAEGNKRRLFLGCALQFFQQMTGTNLINYFSPIIFRSIGLDSSESELLATGVYGIVKMCVVLVGFSSLIDRTGRRPLLVFGGLMLSVCLFAQAVIVSSTPPTTVSSVLGIGFMYLYAVSFALSWGPCPWLYCSEIYPMSMRAKSTSITTALNWTLNAVIGKLSPIMLATSTFGTYVFFGSWCLLAAIFCHLFVLETKGKTLEEIDVLFESKQVMLEQAP